MHWNIYMHTKKTWSKASRCNRCNSSKTIKGVNLSVSYLKTHCFFCSFWHKISHRRQRFLDPTVSMIALGKLLSLKRWDFKAFAVEKLMAWSLLRWIIHVFEDIMPMNTEKGDVFVLMLMVDGFGMTRETHRLFQFWSLQWRELPTRGANMFFKSLWTHRCKQLILVHKLHVLARLIPLGHVLLTFLPARLVLLKIWTRNNPNSHQMFFFF